jgi:hypothetical protein
MLFVESEFPSILTQNYGWLPHIIFMFINQVYLNAHSVKKWKLFNYIEVEKTPSLRLLEISSGQNIPMSSVKWPLALGPPSVIVNLLLERLHVPLLFGNGEFTSTKELLCILCTWILLCSLIPNSPPPVRNL